MGICFTPTVIVKAYPCLCYLSVVVILFTSSNNKGINIRVVT